MKKGPRPLPGPPPGWSAQLQRVQRGPTPGSSSSSVQQAPTPGSSSSDQHRLLAAPPPAPTPTPANASPFANTASQRQKDWGWLEKEIKQRRLEAQKDAAFDAAFDAASTPTPAPAPTPAPHNDETRAFGVFGRKREADKSWQQDVCFPNLRDQDFDEDGMMARKSNKDKSKDEDKEARAVRNAPAAATPKKRAGPEGSQGSRARRARRPCQGGDDEGSQGSDVTNSPCSQASTFSLASEWRETFEELEQEAGSGEAEDQEGGHEGAD